MHQLAVRPEPVEGPFDPSSGSGLRANGNNAAQQREGILSSLAVIIPVGPGDQAWRALLPQLNFLPADAEVCLVFCPDNAQPLPQELPQLAAKVICTTAPTGRARQLNAGVAATQNAELWFVHADSSLSANTRVAITRAIGSALHANALHYFDLRFATGSSSKMRINEFGVWLRTRLFRLPFGDQGFLLSRANFIRLGGYDETLPSAEDHALIWRARRAGMAIRAIGASLSTSARRYAQFGWGKTTWKHLRLTWQQWRAFANMETSRPPHRHPGAGREPFCNLSQARIERQSLEKPMDPGLRRADNASTDGLSEAIGKRNTP